MSNHTFKYIEDGATKHYARCSCRFQTKSHQHRWQVEDEVREHLTLIERVKSYLGTKNPTLKSQRDYYLERAEDPDETPANRRLWLQLAEELTPRVKPTKGETVDEPMFHMEPIEKKAGDRT